MSGQTLYRLFNEAGALLYVGVTSDPGKRWKQHAGEKAWWPEVASITMSPYPDRSSVLDAEREAIVSEQPRHNVNHNTRVLAERLADTINPAGERDDDEQLPDGDLLEQLAFAGRKLRESIARRNLLIRDASARGGSLREIAALVGMSNPGVLRIVRRGGDDQA